MSQQDKDQKHLEDRYGGKEHLNNHAIQLALEATDYYAEYDVDGTVKKPIAKKEFGQSRYQEDVIELNHQSVWGSWWNKTLGWGYACCHATTRNQRCLMEKGKKMALVKEYKKQKEIEEAYQATLEAEK